MPAYNKTLLAGNLTRDVELRFTPKGTAVANISVAINRKYRDSAGQALDEVTFVECAAFGQTAENMQQYLRKGSAVFIEGRLKMNEWEDKRSGAKRSRLSVLVETIQFLTPTNLTDSTPSRTKSEDAFARNDSPPELPDSDDVPF